jgi:hydroxymethylpyrimidine pyrophosphatase-like HAD family hydrolase
MLSIHRHHGDGPISWSRDGDGCLRAVTREGPCYKFVFVCDTEEHTLDMRRALLAELGDRYHFDRSWPVGLEMTALDSGKGAAIRWMRAHLPGLRTVIAVGDYENDISMIEEADVGCAVADAIPAVREAADRVIVPHTEHAIRCIVDSVIPALDPA